LLCLKTVAGYTQYCVLPQSFDFKIIPPPALVRAGLEMLSAAIAAHGERAAGALSNSLARLSAIATRGWHTRAR
jgi:hypothetical protein